MSTEVVIVAATRTAVGKFGGTEQPNSARPCHRTAASRKAQR